MDPTLNRYFVLVSLLLYLLLARAFGLCAFDRQTDRQAAVKSSNHHTTLRRGGDCTINDRTKMSRLPAGLKWRAVPCRAVPRRAAPCRAVPEHDFEVDLHQDLGLTRGHSRIRR